MLVLLSPAKKLDFEPETRMSGPAVGKTKPRLNAKTAALAEAMRGHTARDIASLMSLSDPLAELNRERFQAFGEQSRRPAVLAFAGDVYRGLDAKSLGADGLAAAQDRMRILSGLYGLLRPLDAIEPYRLEMGTKLRAGGASDLYGYWGDDIAKLVAKDLSGHQDRTVVNLASNEYFRAAKGVDARVVTPVFKEEKDGQARTLALFAKVARGMMARYAIDERADQAEALKGFTGGGYRYQPSQSDDTTWVFTRPQPPKKS